MTDYYFKEEHRLFRDSLKTFLQKEVIPYADEWEEKGKVPPELWLKCGEMGYSGLNIPEKYGGTEADFFYFVILMEELSKCKSGGSGMPLLTSMGLVTPYIMNFGSEQLKEKYLPRCASGELIGCIAITEPGAGSNVAGIKTTAVRDGDDYIINGSKTFITGGATSNFIIAAVKTEPEMGSGGVSLIIIDREMQGVSANPLKKLGLHASDTSEIFFDAVRVPASQLVGQENMGFYYIMQNFALERLTMAISWHAMSEDAIDYTLRYMNEREAFGRKINRFQVLRHRIAQLSSEIERVKIFNYNVSRAFADGHNVVKQCAMAKLLSTELGDKVTTECLQCFGGYGFMEEYKIARLFRDSRAGTLAGGTSEIMRDLIAKLVVDEVAYEPVD